MVVQAVELTEAILLSHIIQAKYHMEQHSHQAICLAKDKMEGIQMAELLVRRLVVAVAVAGMVEQHHNIWEIIQIQAALVVLVI